MAARRRRSGKKSGPLMDRNKIARILVLVLAIPALAFVLRPCARKIKNILLKKKTVAEVIRSIGPRARADLERKFRAASAPYPPRRLVFIAYKKEKTLEIWAPGKNGKAKRALTYPVLAASGGPGPKLREGDRQVPEGIYRIIGFNPNSSFHLSLKLNYPNTFDLSMARKEKRENPGSDIFIHGKAASVGCLAMGDSAVEEIFYLTHATGARNIRVLILPERKIAAPPPGAPPWTESLYRKLRGEIEKVSRGKL